MKRYLFLIGLIGLIFSVACEAAFPPPILHNKYTTNQNPEVSANVYTVATLPTPEAGSYPIVYCSDVITPQGVGGFIRWRGTRWKTWDHVQATANYTNYMINCWSAMLNFQSTLTYARAIRDLGEPLENDMVVNRANGGTYSLTRSALATFHTENTGTATNGYSEVRGVQAMTTVATVTNYMALGAAIALQSLSDGTDTFYSFFGFSSAFGTNKPQGCAEFLYDPYNITGHGQTGAITNCWMAHIATNNTHYYYNTGLTPSTSTAAPDRLMVLFFPTWVGFYTNGVLSVSTVTNVPNGNGGYPYVYPQKMGIAKWKGTSDRYIAKAFSYLQVRHVSPPATLP